MEMDLYLVAVGLLGNNELTEERLEGLLEKLKVISGADEDVLDTVRKQLESTIGITMTAGEGLHGGEQEPWLEELKAEIDWHYWSAYKNLLKSNKMSLDVIRVLDEDTDNVLNECGNPQVNHGWKIRGLVMGDVQSGKTANYCGLINKAADSGYKVIVLLTGMIEELRAQSQWRLDEGFVGRNSCAILDGTRTTQTIGAGRFRSKMPNVLTSVESDFLLKNAESLKGIPLKNINEPVLLVLKKNVSPLGNLIEFLDRQLKFAHGATQLDLPLLLIDEEADNASVNAKKDEDPTTINRLIRGILDRFSKYSYVAYTATPFANAFINPDFNDLFPANFVYSLNTPTNYIGASSIFLESGSNHHQLIDIDDADTYFSYKHKPNHVVTALPASLEDAIHAFLITCCIRDIRKEHLKHRSMLVNVTRFTGVQTHLTLVVKQYLYNLIEEIKQYLSDDDAWKKHKLLTNLYDVWDKHFSTSETYWDDIRKSLYDSVASVKVLTINKDTDAADRLNYPAYKNSEKGRRAIVIGGLTLSRGLTLEGLSTSYFYRNSKAYDTLLQMGRWFGYRPGYGDLCRIWMDPDVQEWFEHIAHVVTELRLDIKRMHANRQPPERFGMRVRTHPGTLLGKLNITARNKMRNAQEVEHSVSYSGYGAETPFLPKSDQTNKENINEIGNLLSVLEPATRAGSRYLWEGVKAKKVAAFLRRLNISDMNLEFITDISGADRPLISFIAENSIKSLDEWDVCIPQGAGEIVQGLEVLLTDGSISTIRCRTRQFEKVRKQADFLKLNKQRLGEISDEIVLLPEGSADKAKEEWELLRKSDPELGKTVPGSFYRQYRDRPLLTIHIIQPRDPNPEAISFSRMMPVTEIEPKVLVGVSLSFPIYGDTKHSYVRYRLNLVALRQIGLVDDQEGGDDED